MGNFTTITGVMGSGKSTRLISDYFTLTYRGINIYVIKPLVDVRDLGVVKSRNIPTEVQANCVLDKDQLLPTAEILLGGYTYIFVDEAQFLTEKQILELYKITGQSNIHVVLYGLQMCWKGIPFKSMQLAMGLADKHEILKVYNSRGERLTHQLMTLNGTPVPITEDAPEVYIGDISSSITTIDKQKTNLPIDSSQDQPTADQTSADQPLPLVKFYTVTKEEFYNIYSNL